MTRSTTTAPRTGRTWKATVAVGAAVALLAAGGATFAEWSDSEDLGNATSIQSGTLALTATEEQGTWTNIVGDDVTAAIQNGSYRIVPGDALTFTDSVFVAATGNLLSATVSTKLPTVTGEGAAELVDRLKTDAEMTIDGVEIEGLSAPVAPADEDRVLEVAVTLAFDAAGDSGLKAQGQTVDLNTMTINLEQNAVTSTDG